MVVPVIKVCCLYEFKTLQYFFYYFVHIFCAISRKNPHIINIRRVSPGFKWTKTKGVCSVELDQSLISVLMKFVSMKLSSNKLIYINEKHWKSVKMHYFASSFPKIFRGWHPRTPLCGAALRARRAPSARITTLGEIVGILGFLFNSLNELIAYFLKLHHCDYVSWFFNVPLDISCKNNYNNSMFQAMCCQQNEFIWFCVCFLGHKGAFNWLDYLRHTKAIAAPVKLFAKVGGIPCLPNKDEASKF